MELFWVHEVFYSSGPSAGACSGWTGKGRLCTWDTQPGFRWVSPTVRDPVGQPSHPSLSSAPAWRQRVLPEQEMLLSIRLTGNSSLTTFPRDQSAVPGGEHPSLRPPHAQDTKQHLYLSLPAVPIALRSKASARCLHPCSKGTIAWLAMAGSSPSPADGG